MSCLAETITQIREKKKDEQQSMSLFLRSSFPDTIKALEKIDDDFMRPKRRKGFNLVPIESKKYGRRLYARLSYKGKTLPTKFNTHTDNEKEAELYVLKNKDRLIDEYLSRKDGRMYKILDNFYDEEKDSCKCETNRRYKAVIKDKFIPFLQQEKISNFGQITRNVLIKFQDTLLKGVNIGDKKYMPQPQTVNNNVKAVKKIFRNLERQNIIQQNPCDFLKGLPVRTENKKPRGCYELEKIKGVFNRKWKDELSYLLCLLIYSTGMRNGEIQRLKINDIQLINGSHFIKIEKSKTINGIRMIPLHKILYEKIKAWGIKNKVEENPLFNVRNSKFENANKELARRLKVSDEELERENITFYSGRHFWKTLMSAEGLGEDIEEIWMGHKVTGNVAKLYNHRDKQGRGRMLKKAKKVFSILDDYIFKTKP